MRRYRNMLTNKTVSITFLTLLLALAITGYSYSHWMETIHIQGTITTAKAQLIITSDKLLTPTGDFNDTHPIYYYVTEDNTTLIANCENVTGQEWTIKIGLIVKNNGTMPIYLTETAITFNVSEPIFTATTYYYYPFDTAKWDLTFNNVPPSDNISTPIQLEPDEKAITW
ncbi:MAG: hypothetical protein QXR76_06390, partial [Candidatus Bathyarchaeia archaeon]